jgi:tetratricopeptide (TPR) repeat protein
MLSSGSLAPSGKVPSRIVSQISESPSRRLDEALQVFDKAIQLKPDDPQAWIRLANMLAALGRKAEAFSAYQQVLQLDPRQWDAAYQCGLLPPRIRKCDTSRSRRIACPNFQVRSGMLIVLGEIPLGKFLEIFH